MVTRTLAITVLALSSSFATAALTDTRVDFDISPFSAEGISFDKLLLDVESTPRFMQAHGMLFSSTASRGAPVTGTCLFSDGGGAFCTLSYGTNVFTLSVQASGNGNYQVANAAGAVLVSGNALLASIQ